MGALSVLTGIGNVGEQFGEAKDAVRQESEARANKLREFSSHDAYLQLAKQAEQRQQAEFEERKKSARYHVLPSGEVWDVQEGKWVDQSQPDPMVHLKQFIDQQPPETRKALTDRAQLEVETNPHDKKTAIKSVLDYANELHKEEVRKQDKAEEEKRRQEDALSRRKELETYQTEERKSREANQLAVAKIMTDYRLNEKAKFMTPQERQQYESIKSLEPMVTRLRGFLENNKMTEENNYLFGDHSALMQHARAAGYKGGVKQEPKTQELIKDAAAISIMGAAPWVRIGRGKYTLEQIQQHLPKQTDTPANMYDKVQWLQDEVLENAKSSLAGLTPPGGSSAAQSSGGGGATQKFTSGGRVYNIPSDQVEEFKKDHPDAR